MQGFFTGADGAEKLIKLLKELEKESKKSKRGGRDGCELDTLGAKLKMCWGVITGKMDSKMAIIFAHQMAGFASDVRFAGLSAGAMLQVMKRQEDNWSSDDMAAIKKLLGGNLTYKDARATVQELFDRSSPNAKGVKRDRKTGFGVINGGRDD